MDSPRRSRTELAGGGTWHSAWDRQTLSQHKLANDLEEHARRADALVASLDQKITSARALEDEQTQISRAAASNTSVGGVSPRHVSIFGGASPRSFASAASSAGEMDRDETQLRFGIGERVTWTRDAVARSQRRVDEIEASRSDVLATSAARSAAAADARAEAAALSRENARLRSRVTELEEAALAAGAPEPPPAAFGALDFAFPFRALAAARKSLEAASGALERAPPENRGRTPAALEAVEAITRASAAFEAVAQNALGDARRGSAASASAVAEVEAASDVPARRALGDAFARSAAADDARSAAPRVGGELALAGGPPLDVAKLLAFTRGAAAGADVEPAALWLYALVRRERAARVVVLGAGGGFASALWCALALRHNDDDDGGGEDALRRSGGGGADDDDDDDDERDAAAGSPTASPRRSPRGRVWAYGGVAPSAECVALAAALGLEKFVRFERREVFRPAAPSPTPPTPQIDDYFGGADNDDDADGGDDDDDGARAARLARNLPLPSNPLELVVADVTAGVGAGARDGAAERTARAAALVAFYAPHLAARAWLVVDGGPPLERVLREPDPSDAAGRADGEGWWRARHVATFRVFEAHDGSARGGTRATAALRVEPHPEPGDLSPWCEPRARAVSAGVHGAAESARAASALEAERLERARRRARSAAFKRMDANGDGVVSQEEWEAFCVAELHATAPTSATHLDDIDDE